MSAQTTSINIRVDSDLKSQAESLFADLGLTMSGAITMFLRASVGADGLPFPVRRSPNAQTREALREFEAMRDDAAAYPRYDSFRSLMDEVLTDA